MQFKLDPVDPGLGAWAVHRWVHTWFGTPTTAWSYDYGGRSNGRPTGDWGASITRFANPYGSANAWGAPAPWRATEPIERVAEAQLRLDRGACAHKVEDDLDALAADAPSPGMCATTTYFRRVVVVPLHFIRILLTTITII